MPTATKVLTVLDAFKKLKYDFRLNECTQRIELNGEPLTDGDDARIRIEMRDFKILNAKLIEDMIVSTAWQNKFHPVKAYLKKCIKTYDNKKHICKLTDCITDADKVFGFVFRYWMIGAVARVMQSEFNPMLVMDGEQGIGKSELSRWLCPLPDYFVESAVNPEDKDSKLRLASSWIWEVDELGATVRRADREALKSFISKKWVTERPPYGHHDIKRPAMASLIGTVNDECGLLNDPTGNRRFMICRVEKIDWSYRNQIDKNQLWGEAYQAYLDGESSKLKPDEYKRLQVVNERYEIDDAIEGILKRNYKVDANRTDRWTPTYIILERLYGVSGNTRSNTIALGSCCRRLKLIRQRKMYRGQFVWGFTGLIPFKNKPTF